MFLGFIWSKHILQNTWLQFSLTGSHIKSKQIAQKYSFSSSSFRSSFCSYFWFRFTEPLSSSMKRNKKYEQTNMFIIFARNHFLEWTPKLNKTFFWFSKADPFALQGWRERPNHRNPFLKKIQVLFQKLFQNSSKRV